MIPQKKKEHYFKKKYNGLDRFISYFYQVDLVTSHVGSPADKILEIGVGNGLVSDHLKKMCLSVTTCDFDETLKPDIVADIRELPFPDNGFDVVMAFEVLEHIPFEDFAKALQELKRVSSKTVIISLPYRSTFIEIVLRFPFVRTLIKKDFLSIFFRFPWFFKGFKSSGQHYWEMDGYKYRLGKVMKVLKNNFRSVKKIKPVLDGYKLFFVLEK